METASLFPDFKEFLRLLNSVEVRYLLIGGYAVNFHGHYRTTGDMDIWIAVDPENARRVSEVLRKFGFSAQSVPPNMFLEVGKIFRFGITPVRIELLTLPDGIEFESCYSRRINAEIDGVPVSVIALPDLIANKRASGRPKDHDDLLNLPPVQ
jgi:predicted nucleotidyltransferase